MGAIQEKMEKKEVFHFEIIEKIDEGGMGKVFLAEDTHLNRKVALKFLPSHLTSNRQLIDRFKREARAAASLKHPNIVTIYEMGKHDGEFYIAMEYIDGLSLSQLIAQKRLSLKKSLQIAIQIARGLRKAHDVGIIHRDIKPANIMMDKDGWIKVLDFGLAKLTLDTRITRNGTRMGTAPYISPEQLKGLELAPSSDIFSIGVILYQLIAASHPFSGQTEEEIIYSILKKTPRPLPKTKVHGTKLQKIIDKALKKNPAERYQSVEELLGDLKRERQAIIRQEKEMVSVKPKSAGSITLNIPEFDTNWLRVHFDKLKKSLFDKTEGADRQPVKSNSFKLAAISLITMMILFSGAGLLYSLRQTPEADTLQALFQSETTKSLFTKFKKFSRKKLISVGKDLDCVSEDNCYLFVYDAKDVIDVFEIRDNFFCSLNSDQTFSAFPNHLSRNNKIWVKAHSNLGGLQTREGAGISGGGK